MKKIYLSLLAGMAFCGAVFGQSAAQYQPVKIVKNPRPVRTAAPDQAPKPFAYWVDPVGDMMYYKGVKIYESDPNNNVVGGFVSPLFCDSTVKYYDSSNKLFTNSSNFQGSVLDPQSQYLLEMAGGDPIVTAADPYNLDTLQILGRYYITDSTKTDSLHVYIQWGKPNDKTVFTRQRMSDLFGPTLFTWKDSVLGANVKGASGTPGPVVTSAAPATNYKLIRYALKKTDAVKASDNYAVYINVKVDGVTIPAGNVVSMYYTYVPQAGSTKLDDVFYTFGTSLRTVNGYGAQVWQQKSPAIVTDADWQDYMVDPSTKNSGGLSYSKTARYALNTFRKDVVYGYPISVPIVNYKISGFTTVGITEHTSNFSLSQNAPNPFSNETTIAYSLKTPAKNVSLFIYNVAGVKVFERAQTNQGTGQYSVEVNNSNFASGIYFYTLNVDGNQITKKMVVTE